jgi:hypothetical protein
MKIAPYFIHKTWNSVSEIVNFPGIADLILIRAEFMLNTWTLPQD